MHFLQEQTLGWVVQTCVHYCNWDALEILFSQGYIPPADLVVNCALGPRVYLFVELIRKNQGLLAAIMMQGFEHYQGIGRPIEVSIVYISIIIY